MANLRRDFTKASMDLDTDTRLLPEGKFRRAENINVINSEGSDVGSIQKSYSNKKLTDIDFGENPQCFLGHVDETRDRIYWFIKSDNGCYLLEWDNQSEIISYVLIDTRPEGERVLDLKDGFLITGIGKIITDTVNDDLLLWTDDNMELCCINIERAKTYGENNFTKEDIYLIKKPPVAAPELLPINISGLTNNMEERFLSYACRYKYLDGEYSAISTFTNYSFNPREFDLDYYTLDNKGMVNAFNAVRVSFNTGEKQVTDVQLLVKESNSNNIYIVETFNKINEGLADNSIKTFTFSNNKIYIPLPSTELKRTFDNVPLKAKALAIIGNMPVFGNYVEGRDLIDADGNKVFPDYELSLINEPIETGQDFIVDFPETNELTLTNPLIDLLQGNRIVFSIVLNIEGDPAYENSFYYILPEDYDTLLDVFDALEFVDFIAIIDADIKNNYTFALPFDWSETTAPNFEYSISGGLPLFTITPITFTDASDSSTHVKTLDFVSSTYVSISSFSNSSTVKTNRDVEVGVVYEDDFGRKTTVLTSIYNSIYIPQLYSIFKNRIKITLRNKPPQWAKRFRLVFKTQPLQYQTIYVNKFYNEDFFVWAKLEAENKDKVKVGEFLIVKKAPNPISTPIKVKVLEIKEQIKDFIVDNNDENGNPIIEEAGFYMKIRPEGFSMGYSDYQIYQSEFGDIGSSGRPVGYLDLFTEIVSSLPVEISIPSGSSIQLFMNSSFNYDSGWKNVEYDVLHYAQRDYATLEEWFNEIIINKNLYVTDSSGDVRNYKDYVSLVRGTVTTNTFGVQSFTPSGTGKLYFKVRGLETGGSNNRKGYVRAKIVIRTNTGFYVFETEPLLAENDVYFENSQTFDIIDGQHQGNLQNQNTDTLTPAIIDSDFFNCYSQGNGVESYRVRDGFNTRYLNIDLKPSTTLIEEYKQIRRYADLTHGNSFVQGTNLNGLNVFNLSTGNFKELDKQYGSIQKLVSRDNDIVVFQEEKTSKVLFNKTVVYNPDGQSNQSVTNKILGEQVTYLGENGIGTSPESVAVNNYQIYSANPRRGIMQRLSIDGIEEIVNGMVDYFRDLFIERPNAKKIGGFDPYHKQFFISVGEQPINVFSANCGNVLSKSEQSAPFTYTLQLNNLLGDVLFNYNILNGNATIEALYDGISYVASNVTGSGVVSIPRDNVNPNTVQITITPISETITYTITNVCPVGKTMSIVEILLGDIGDAGKTITNRYKWGSSTFYSNDDLFISDEISRFETFTGIEGTGRFANRGQIINMQSYSDVGATASFNPVIGNQLGYLVTNVEYDSTDLATILSLATFVAVTDNVVSKDILFLFDREDDEILYLIWDYRNEIIEIPEYNLEVAMRCSDAALFFTAESYLVKIGYGLAIGTASFNLNNTGASSVAVIVVYNGNIVATGSVETMTNETFTFEKNVSNVSICEVYVVATDVFSINPDCI